MCNLVSDIKNIFENNMAEHFPKIVEFDEDLKKSPDRRFPV